MRIWSSWTLKTNKKTIHGRAHNQIWISNNPFRHKRAYLITVFGKHTIFLSTAITPHRNCGVKGLRSWTEVTGHLMNHIAWIGWNTGEKDDKVHSDNSKKFIVAHAGLRSIGINSTITSAHSPHSNISSIRIENKLLNKVRAMLETVK